MGAEVTAALIEGGTALAGTGLNALSQAKLTKKQFRRSKQLMQYQNDVNLANWNLQNAYNSPKEQVSRLKAAGLNPNLLYGSGTAATGNAGDVGAVSASSGDLGSTDYSAAANGIAQGLSMYQNWQLNKANLAHINADRERLNALAVSENYRQALMAAETSSKNLDNSIKAAAKDNIISKHAADLDIARHTARGLNYQANVAEKTQETAVLRAEADLLNARGEVALKQAGLRQIDANIKNLVASAEYTGNQSKLAQQSYDFLQDHGYMPGQGNTPWSIGAGVIDTVTDNLIKRTGRRKSRSNGGSR